MRNLTRALLVTLPLASTLLWAAGPANRTDVFYTLDFESVFPVTNPDGWQAGMSDSHDGLFVDHIARYEQPSGDGSSTPDGNRTAAVRSLPHAEVIANGKNPSPLTGTNYLKGSIYIRPNDVSGYQVDYSPINGNGKDKPRINLRTRKAIEAEFKRNNSHAAYRTNQYWCFDLGLPSDFREVNSRRLTIMQVVSPVSTPENNIDLSIVGQRGGSVFRVERLFAEGDSGRGRPVDNNGRPIPIYHVPIESSMIGKMITHCFKANIDNRGNTSSFKWMMSVQGESKLRTVASDDVTYGYSPNAGGRGDKPLDFTFNLPYGGSLNEGDSPYAGQIVSLILDNVRIGGPRSSIRDVHPLSFSEP